MISRGLPLLIICYFTGIRAQDSSPEISVQPSPRLKPNTDVNIICKIDPKWASNTVYWWRRTGQITERIGANSVLEDAYMSTKRYTLSQWGQETGISYRLTIQELRLEDSAEIGCSVRGSDADTVFASLAVCDDIETFECKCMQTTGWTSPNCFTKHPSLRVQEEHFNRTKTGLGVCLGIAIFYGLIMTLLVGWDCTARIAAKKKREMELAKLRKSHDPNMYEGDEVKLDPNDTASNIDFESKGPMPPKEGKRSNYTKLNSAEASQSNPAFSHDEDGYQEIRDTANGDPYRRYHDVPPSAPQPKVGPQVSGVLPPNPRSPGGPRPPADGYDGAYGPDPYPRSPSYAPSGYPRQDTPSGAAGGYKYPEQNQRPYHDGQMSPNPRSGYPEPSPRTHGYNSSHLAPRPHIVDENQSSPYNNLSHSNYEEYAPNHSGSFIDKTDTVV